MAIGIPGLAGRLVAITVEVDKNREQEFVMNQISVASFAQEKAAKKGLAKGHVHVI